MNQIISVLPSLLIFFAFIPSSPAFLLLYLCMLAPLPLTIVAPLSFDVCQYSWCLVPLSFNVSFVAPTCWSVCHGPYRFSLLWPPCLLEYPSFCLSITPIFLCVCCRPCLLATAVLGMVPVLQLRPVVAPVCWRGWCVIIV